MMAVVCADETGVPAEPHDQGDLAINVHLAGPSLLGASESSYSTAKPSASATRLQKFVKKAILSKEVVSLLLETSRQLDKAQEQYEQTNSANGGEGSEGARSRWGCLQVLGMENATAAEAPATPAGQPPPATTPEQKSSDTKSKSSTSAPDWKEVIRERKRRQEAEALAAKQVEQELKAVWEQQRKAEQQAKAVKTIERCWINYKQRQRCRAEPQPKSSSSRKVELTITHGLQDSKSDCSESDCEYAEDSYEPLDQYSFSVQQSDDFSFYQMDKPPMQSLGNISGNPVFAKTPRPTIIAGDKKWIASAQDYIVAEVQELDRSRNLTTPSAYGNLERPTSLLTSSIEENRAANRLPPIRTISKSSLSRSEPNSPSKPNTPGMSASASQLSDMQRSTPARMVSVPGSPGDRSPRTPSLSQIGQEKGRFLPDGLRSPSSQSLSRVSALSSSPSSTGSDNSSNGGGAMTRMRNRLAQVLGGRPSPAPTRHMPPPPVKLTDDVEDWVVGDDDEDALRAVADLRTHSMPMMTRAPASSPGALGRNGLVLGPPAVPSRYSINIIGASPGGGGTLQGPPPLGQERSGLQQARPGLDLSHERSAGRVQGPTSYVLPALTRPPLPPPKSLPKLTTVDLAFNPASPNGRASMDQVRGARPGPDADESAAGHAVGSAPTRGFLPRRFGLGGLQRKMG